MIHTQCYKTERGMCCGLRGLTVCLCIEMYYLKGMSVSVLFYSCSIYLKQSQCRNIHAELVDVFGLMILEYLTQEFLLMLFQVS